MGMGSMKRQEQYWMKYSNAQKLWDVGVLSVDLSFVRREVSGEYRGTCVEENQSVSRSPEG